jgi:hypothetical protein
MGTYSANFGTTDGVELSLTKPAGEIPTTSRRVPHTALTKRVALDDPGLPAYILHPWVASNRSSCRPDRSGSD